VVLEHHSVAIERGRIVALEPIDQAQARFAPRERVVLAQHALIPGLINAHTHAAMALLRGVGDDMPLMDWLNQRIWPLERALVSADFVHQGTRLAALEMVAAGVTCCNDMYFYPGAAAAALRSVGMRAVIGIVALEFPSPYASDAADYLRQGLATRDALRDDPLLRFTLAPHAPYSVADATFDSIRILAEELDCPIHMHVHETLAEIEQSRATHGVRPLARLDRLGLVNERLLAVHAVHLETDEIALLAQRGCNVVHCPSSNLKLASGIAPIAQLLAAGVGVAIGSDGAASNNRLDILGEMRLAALLAKGATHDPTVLPAAQALEAATFAGARALGLEDLVGSIEIGKAADLAAIALTDAAVVPCYDVVSQIVYAASREHVTDVWVAGTPVVQKRHLMFDGEPTPSAEILNAAVPWQNRVRKFLNWPLA
jgi:5-methylthioadenosine/S-adenosylhomocysteine deaminase